MLNGIGNPIAGMELCTEFWAILRVGELCLAPVIVPSSKAGLILKTDIPNSQPATGGANPSTAVDAMIGRTIPELNPLIRPGPALRLTVAMYMLEPRSSGSFRPDSGTGPPSSRHRVLI